MRFKKVVCKGHGQMSYDERRETYHCKICGNTVTDIAIECCLIQQFQKYTFVVEIDGKYITLKRPTFIFR